MALDNWLKVYIFVFYCCPIYCVFIGVGHITIS